MAISKCISLSAENRIEKNVSNTEFHVNETGFRGTPDFPVAVYLDDVTHEYVNWHWHEEFEIGLQLKDLQKPHPSARLRSYAALK